MRVIALKFFYYTMLLLSLLIPQVGVYFYQFISIIRPEQLTHGTTQVYNLFAVSIVVLFTSFYFRGKIKFSSFFENGLLYLLLFIIALFFSTYLSQYTKYSGLKNFQYLLSIFQIYIFLVVVNSYLNSKNIKYFILMELFLFIFMALWGVEQRFLGNILVENLFGYSIKDRCAITAIFVLVFPISLCLKGNLFSKLIKLVSSVLFVLIIFFTDSRAGFLAFISSICFLFYFSANKIKRIILISLLIFISLFIIPDTYIERMSSISYQDVSDSDEVNDYSSAGRLVLWRLGVYVFLDNPFLGVGNLNFRVASSNYIDKISNDIDPALINYVFSDDGTSLIVHNLFINSLAEGGLFSSIPLFVFIFYPFILFIKKKNRSNLEISITAGLLGFFVAACFANMTFIDYWYWHVFLLWKILSLENVEFNFFQKSPNSTGINKG